MKRFLAVSALVVLITGIAFAQGIGFYGIGGGLGFVNVSPSGAGESFSGLGFHARAEMGELTDNLALVPELHYWSVSKDLGGFDWSYSDFAINANVQYRFDMEGSVAPYVGGGLGLNIMSVSSHVPFFGSVSVSETKIGLNLLGGAHMKLEGNIHPFAEFRYVIVSNVNHLMIMAGIVYHL